MGLEPTTYCLRGIDTPSTELPLNFVCPELRKQSYSAPNYGGIMYQCLVVNGGELAAIETQ